MKKKFLAIIITMLLFFLIGCGSNILTPINVPMQKGGLSLKMDFSTLNVSISQVVVELTNPSYEPIHQNLTIQGKTAYGLITDIPEDLWHVRVEVYNEAAVMTYFGEADITIMSGTTQTCNFTFNEENDDTKTGALNIEIFINDFPGHTLIPQNVDYIEMGHSGDIYIMDSANMQIKVYDFMNYCELHKFEFSDCPIAMTIADDETALYVAFTTGHLLRVDIPTGVTTVITNHLNNIKDIVSCGQYILVRSTTDMDKYFYLVDKINGDVLYNSSEPLDAIEYGKISFNQFSESVYFITNNAGQIMLNSMHIDTMSGLIIDPVKTVIPTEPELTGELSFIKAGERLITPSGKVYKCSIMEPENLTLIDNTNYPFYDLAYDSMSNRIYLINRYETDPMFCDPSQIKMIVMDGEKYFIYDRVQLEGFPQKIFSQNGEILIITEREGSWYFKKYPLI